MAATYVRLALDEPVDLSDAYDFAENYYAVRAIDTAPAIIDGRALFDVTAIPREELESRQ